MTHGSFNKIYQAVCEREKDGFFRNEKEKRVRIKTLEGKSVSFVGRIRLAKILRHFAAVSRDNIR